LEADFHRGGSPPDGMRLVAVLERASANLHHQHALLGVLDYW
jgi:hypothetical protein